MDFLLWIIKALAFHLIGCIIVTVYVLVFMKIIVKGVKDGIESKMSVLRGNVQQKGDQDPHKMEA